MAQVTFIKFDASNLANFGETLNKLSPEALGKRMVETVNTVTTQTYDLARETMLSGINLTDDYVKRKMEVKLATGQKPVAEIAARVTRKSAHTNLSEYGAMTNTARVNWTNERIAAMGQKFGKWPGWTRRTGAQSIGVAVNQKATGVSVEVKRGARKNLKSSPGFQLGKLKDGSGNPLVFERVGSGKSSKIKAMYGPSVYQLFRVAAGKIENQVGDNLRDAVMATAEQAMKEIL